MKNVVWFLVLTLSTIAVPQKDLNAHKKGAWFSRPRGEVNEKSTNDELTKLMRNQVAIGDPKERGLLSPYCLTLDMIPQCENKVDLGIHCVFNRASCYVVGIKSATASVYLLSKSPKDQAPTGSERCANRPEFQAVYLPFAQNGDTYTKLDPQFAPWFFTDELGGCDMFVATTPGQGRNPLVIHSNRNSCDLQAQNLQFKEEQADKILASFNDPSLKIIARVYYKPKRPPQEVEAVEKYLIEYRKRQPQVRLFDYNNYCDSFPDGQSFLFFGHFATSGHWKFFLKGVKSGQMKEFGVSQQGDVIASP